ncbi:MAG TPA: VOC family protein [Rhodothermales bacterium]|nr:VOC family protein [Rhodothermales bacterium]
MSQLLRSICFSLLFLAVISPVLGQPSTDTTDSLLRVHEVKVKVTDMAEALTFYRDLLGLPVLSEANYPASVLLDGEVLPLRLERTRHAAPVDYPQVSQTILVFETADLVATMARLKAHHVTFLTDPPEPYGFNQETGKPLGLTTKVRDPFGNVHSLVEQQVRRDTTLTGIRIYNIGYYLPDMQAARAIYNDKLGFVPMTENYLPAALPLLHADGSFGFMLHEHRGLKPTSINYPDDTQSMIVFATSDLHAAAEALRQQGVTLLHDEPQSSPEGKYLAFRDRFGNVAEIIERPLSSHH